MKILISSRSFKIDSKSLELLKQYELEPVFNPFGRKLSENELIEMIDDDIVGIIAGTEEITKKIILQAKSLKVISRFGIGLDNIDINFASNMNIQVYYTPDEPTDAVAELTLALILNLLRKVCLTDRNFRQKLRKPEMGNILKNKKVGIVGLGRIGKRLVQLLKPFDVEIYACEKKPDEKFISKNNIILTKLPDLFKKSDIISIHLPLNDETRGIVGRAEISKMKSDSILVNTSRGEVIDEHALYDALKKKKICSAACDVFYTDLLKELDNTIITPHIGSLTYETRENMEEKAVKNLIKGLKETNVL